MSNAVRWKQKKVIPRRPSAGVSIRATRASRYSLIPSKSKQRSEGITERGSECRLSCVPSSMRDWEVVNLRESVSRLVNAERAAAIASGVNVGGDVTECMRCKRDAVADYIQVS